MIQYKTAHKFPHLKSEITTIILEKDRILTKWLEKPEVKQIIVEQLKMETSFFKEKFAQQVYEFMIKIIKGEESTGECPIIGTMILLFKKYNIPLSDVFEICVNLKNSFQLQMLTLNKLTPEILEESATLIDKNFKGVIQEYVAIYYKDLRHIYVKSCKIKSQKPNTSVPNKINKTSAKEYLLDIDGHEEIIQELSELEEDVLNVLDVTNELNAYMLSESIQLLDKYRKEIKSLLEFEELSEAITLMINTLNKNFIETINHQYSHEVTHILIAIIKDLKSWRVNIFETHEATDIHYLDETLKSAIEQFIHLITAKEIKTSMDFF